MRKIVVTLIDGTLRRQRFSGLPIPELDDVQNTVGEVSNNNTTPLPQGRGKEVKKGWPRISLASVTSSASLPSIEVVDRGDAIHG
jgi:hypothetical protein